MTKESALFMGGGVVAIVFTSLAGNNSPSLRVVAISVVCGLLIRLIIDLIYDQR